MSESEKRIYLTETRINFEPHCKLSNAVKTDIDEIKRYSRDQIIAIFSQNKSGLQAQMIMSKLLGITSDVQDEDELISIVENAKPGEEVFFFEEDDHMNNTLHKATIERKLTEDEIKAEYEKAEARFKNSPTAIGLTILEIVVNSPVMSSERLDVIRAKFDSIKSHLDYQLVARIKTALDTHEQEGKLKLS